jgi:hypothetical protein
VAAEQAGREVMLNYPSKDGLRQAAEERRDWVLSSVYEWTADCVSLGFVLLLIYFLFVR